MVGYMRFDRLCGELGNQAMERPQAVKPIAVLGQHIPLDMRRPIKSERE
jgi:hypothetical protein